MIEKVGDCLMPMDLAPFIDGRAIHQIYAGETRSCHERNKSRVKGNFATLNPLRFKINFWLGRELQETASHMGVGGFSPSSVRAWI